MESLIAHYRLLLGLNDDWTVDDVDLSVADKRVSIALSFVGDRVTCPECGAVCCFHDHAPDRRWRHLDTMQFETILNEKEQPLEKITLRELLGNIRDYLADASSWKGDRTSLLAEERDSHVLVSAQACFLPIPKDGIAEFNPVLFNYQSRAGDPAVLTILATREGTSITVIDNERDEFEAGGTWGQRLFFNQNGERASLTGQRKSDFLSEANIEAKGKSTPSPTPDDREGLNLVLLIQVPLKQKEPMRFDDTLALSEGDDTGVMRCYSVASDVEEAVIGHGKVEGPFTEIDGLEIERDDQYPIRVTVQFYKATSNGVVSEQDMQDIADQINKVYKQADYVGSLIVEGPTGRPTEYHGTHVEPPQWWEAFWKRHCDNTGQTHEDAIAMLRKLLGKNWQEASLEEAEQAVAQTGPGTTSE